MSTEHRTTQRQRHSETATINGATNPGGRYGDLNQDRYLVHTITNMDSSHPQKMARIAGVFDGHSMLGEHAAQIASDAFQEFFEKAIRQEWSSGKSFVPTEAIINEAFDYAHAKILKLYEDLPKDYKYPFHGKTMSFHLKDGTQIYVSGSNDERQIEFGTTAVIALIIDDTLVVANSGDSQCIVGTKNEKAVYLSTAHSCKNRDEVRRIRTEFPASKFTSGGNYLRASEDGQNDVLINMTRALGHKSISKFGVIHNPSISFKTLTDDDAFIILASDGVWDNLTGHEAVMFVTDAIDEGEDMESIPNGLIEKSLEDVDTISHRDNATAVVIALA